MLSPPRDLDYKQNEQLPWRLQSHISGGGYFYDLAPHQLDLLQNMFGVIVKAHGYTANRAGLYSLEDTVNAVYRFETGLTGSGAWCFAAHESAPRRPYRGLWVERTPFILCLYVCSYPPLHQSGR